jgi:hypothetical protein
MTPHCSRDVRFGEGKWYTASNTADEENCNEHIYSDVIEESKPNPMVKQPSDRQMEEPLDDDSLPDPPKAKKQ